MKSRKEILLDINKTFSFKPEVTATRYAEIQIELLLDIRELLKKMVRK